MEGGPDPKWKSRWLLWFFLQHVEEDSRTGQNAVFTREGCQRGFFICRHNNLQFFSL